MLCPKCRINNLVPPGFESRPPNREGRYRTKCNKCKTTITLNSDLSLYQKSRIITEEEREKIISLKQTGISFEEVSKMTGISYRYCYYIWQDFYKGGFRGHQ